MTGYVAIPLAAGVAYPLDILLSPTIGAALMSLSTIIVDINARLLELRREAGRETGPAGLGSYHWYVQLRMRSCPQAAARARRSRAGSGSPTQRRPPSRPSATARLVVPVVNSIVTMP